MSFRAILDENTSKCTAKVAEYLRRRLSRIFLSNPIIASSLNQKLLFGSNKTDNIYWVNLLNESAVIYCVYKANILKLFRNRIVLLEHIDFKSQPPNYSYRRHDAWFSKVSHRTSRHLQASRAVARQRCLEATTCHRRRRDRRNLVEKLVEIFLEIVKIFQTFQNFYEIVWNCLKLFATFCNF